MRGASALRLIVPLCGVLAAAPAQVVAQDVVDGSATSAAIALPAGDAFEWRTRLFIERAMDLGPRLRLMGAAWAEGLVAKHPGPGGVRDATAEVDDASVLASFGRVDVLAGYTRVVWGVLDELQPTDVINPLDVSRYLLEGRSEARLPIALVRARVFLPRNASIEAVVAPLFRRGRFDSLAEASSPFSPLEHERCFPGGLCIPLVYETAGPGASLSNVQGGGRFKATTHRVDWTLSAWRGIEPFPLFNPPAVPSSSSGAEPTPPASAPPLTLRGVHPRFTMVGGDVETVVGPWELRGETAVFLRDAFQSVDPTGVATGRRIVVGGGADRRAGDYRVGALVTAEWRRADAPFESASDTDVVLAGFGERRFARQTRSLRVFGVFNATDANMFTRAIGAISLRDDVWLEGSAGVFAGEGDDVFGQFNDADFVYVRLKVYF